MDIQIKTRSDVEYRELQIKLTKLKMQNDLLLKENAKLKSRLYSYKNNISSSKNTTEIITQDVDLDNNEVFDKATGETIKELWNYGF